ncbi:uncharacterized protein LOC105187314 [Harpegnathos saltator]|uniref:Essential protein Yae1 N-terminal domain-containing protein n=1 Tax=Harpegnathos saltator TaxID=610380 RepID=E2BWH5_HARSA|nr:uncharacterized protein LOC105187314 [Harpegnathos saltator]EFN79931.1 hypothetical protein EAI_16213 [Harpegnathos saltator]
MENDSYSQDDDSLDIASKSCKRVVDIATKTGYREGVQDGEDSVLQESFDIGYKDGFKTAFILGKYKGLSHALSSNIKHPVDIAATLDKTKRGICWICKMESENTTYNYENISFSEILKNQKKHSTEVLNKLHEHFQPVLKESNIEVDLNP